ncbi:MAG: lipocalin-like domain-containing protein [Acetobacteraceae bacterium]|nr:lipocalin-like domain-containing protein [Acetobacteraceae bacterium]
MSGHPVRRAVLTACMALPAWSAFAQDTADLVGTWQLVSSVTEKDGKTTDQFGTGAAGMMSLDANDRFMLTIIGPDLPKFVANNRAGGTEQENRAVVGRSIAMLGTFAVDRAGKTLTFKVERATFPNWDETEQRRRIVVANSEELKYVTPTASSGGIGTVTWRRLK